MKLTLLYCVISFSMGGIIMTFITYLYVCSRYEIQYQRQKIIRFIRTMKRLRKEEKEMTIRYSIKRFTQKCINFHPESFTGFRRKEFDDIALLLRRRDNQYLPPPFIHEDNGMGMRIQSLEQKDIITDDELQEEIFQKLWKVA